MRSTLAETLATWRYKSSNWLSWNSPYPNGICRNTLSDTCLQIRGRLSSLRRWLSYGAVCRMQAFTVFPCIRRISIPSLRRFLGDEYSNMLTRKNMLT